MLLLNIWGGSRPSSCIRFCGVKSMRELRRDRPGTPPPGWSVPAWGPGTRCGPPLSLCVEGWGLGGDRRPPRAHRASPLPQFASTARTSSSRCTPPRGSPGTPCVRTIGATATGGPPARTWATGECGPTAETREGSPPSLPGRPGTPTLGQWSPAQGWPGKPAGAHCVPPSPAPSCLW